MHTWCNYFAHAGMSSITHWYFFVLKETEFFTQCLFLVRWLEGIFLEVTFITTIMIPLFFLFFFFYPGCPFAFFFSCSVLPVSYNTVNLSCLETILDVRPWLSNKVRQEIWGRFTRGCDFSWARHGRRARRQHTDYRARTKRALISRSKLSPQQTVKTMNTVRLDNLIKISYETPRFMPCVC